MSTDSHDKRLRASALVHYNGKNLLIDCGPDFRTQMLRAGAPHLDALLVTHSHYDHVGGVDDLRPYCYPHSFPVYCRSDVSEDLHNRIPYSFYEHLYPGVPTFDIHIIDPEKPFMVGDTEVTPLPVMHAKLPILGFKIGAMAYITDCKTMPQSTLDIIKGVDTLVINALREKEHLSHLSLRQALDIIEQASPRRALLTHISHDMPPVSTLALPPHVSVAYDSMTVPIP